MQTRNINCVAIGGGTGLSTLLSGLKSYVSGTADSLVSDLSAIVAVSDDGGSSGRLRDEFQMLPPGDIRNCMVALSEDSNLLSKLFQFRFSGDGELGGHSFGNLFLAALSGVTGDFGEAVKLSSEILASKGRIFPATLTDVRLRAIYADGTTIRGESKIGAVRTRIEKLFLEPADCEPLPEALAAIQKADVITLGPGSLYTSLLPPLLVRGVSEAIADSDAVKVFVCNLMSQPGETEGMTARQHLEVVRQYAASLNFDFIVINNKAVRPDLLEYYEKDGAAQIGIHGSISGGSIEGATVIYANLLAEGDKIRHDPRRLAETILERCDAAFLRRSSGANS